MGKMGERSQEVQTSGYVSSEEVLDTMVTVVNDTV